MIRVEVHLRIEIWLHWNLTDKIVRLIGPEIHVENIKL